MSDDCQHLCCSIPWNDYHVHLSRPGRCQNCAKTLKEGGDDVLEALQLEVVAVAEGVTTRVNHHADRSIDVRQLHKLALAASREVCIEGLTDPDLAGLASSDRRTVLVARAELMLALMRPPASGCYEASGSTSDHSQDL